mmetsp:Transcript_7173/g.13745  ORF Transcript_7173/g.13745 Transcript_7173/m.13745 type:complete len:87 (-) Transcript_7173:623-883(-)
MRPTASSQKSRASGSKGLAANIKGGETPAPVPGQFSPTRASIRGEWGYDRAKLSEPSACRIAAFLELPPEARPCASALTGSIGPAC